MKRKQRITARFADALGELYLMSAALKRFEDDGCPDGDLPLVKWAMVNGMHRIQESFETILQNYTSRPVAWIMRGIIFPFGRRYEPVRDHLEHEMVSAVLEPGETRDRLTHGVFTPENPDEPVRLLEDTFAHAAHADEIWKRMRKAVRAGKIKHGYGPAHYESALAADVISGDEKTFITEYARKVRKIIDVDDFAPHDLSPRPGDNVAPLRP